MAINAQENQEQDSKQTELDKNFAVQRRHFEKQLEQERLARQQAEQERDSAIKAAQEHSRMSPLNTDEDDDAEPYVDKKKLKKALNQFGQQNKVETKQDIEQAVQAALEQERIKTYLKDNPDFYDVMKPEILEKLMKKDPELAESILGMPEGFARNKMVYRNIKTLGLDKAEAKEPSIQDKIDANRRSPFYQPTGVGTPSYQPVGDFSKQGQKNAYDKMMELKGRLQIQ